MIQRSHLAVISLLSGCVLLHGCGSVKKTLGIDRAPPDEFAVTPSTPPPLDMPPDFFVLPPPEPGAPRPQEEREMNDKKAKILGSSSNKGTLSPGQKALLKMAGTEEGQDSIRNEIDKQSRIESAQDKPILQKLGIKGPSKGDVIDPYKETLELQEKGIPQSPAIPQNQPITSE